MSHILIVDPVAARSRVVLELLATVGWEPEAVRTPWEALEVLRRTPVRLMLVSGGVHGSAGLALGYLMRTCTAWQHIPMLQLGGDDTETEWREARRAGLNLCIGYEAGFEELLLQVALAMGNGEVTRAVIDNAPPAAFDAALAQAWQAQIDLLHHPHLMPGSLHAAREMLERLLSVRHDEAAIEAALTLTRVPKGGPALRRWADQHLPCPPKVMDSDFERLMSRCLGPVAVV